MAVNNLKSRTSPRKGKRSIERLCAGSKRRVCKVRASRPQLRLDFSNVAAIANSSKPNRVERVVKLRIYRDDPPSVAGSPSSGASTNEMPTAASSAGLSSQ
jgi:hypothetical protein